MSHATLEIPGEVTVIRKDGDGNILSIKRNIKNVSTNVYREKLLARAFSSTPDLGVFKFGVAGIDPTTETTGDVSLGSETQRVELDPLVDFVQTGTTLEVTFTFGGDWTGTLYEIGIVGGENATSTPDTGDLYFRTTIPAGEVKVEFAQSITIVWTITISDV